MRSLGVGRTTVSASLVREQLVSRINDGFRADF